ncbi:hypothetical protein LG52_3286 [Geobacillus kaustophilus]|uniref:Uncharacterized protein n=1 Tax=Geobacillus kaustophilus TaxID=1462 RepID=A0A0D8BP13_GEOKU|nr:hypothetical protein [Geobacillus kaustophilus]KJE25948.1 hypothetical protein LG52_3286 [Geobacillus kaustophilus]
MKHASRMAAAVCLAAAIALGGNGQTADAAVQWGQVQWKQGMIGKVVILRDTSLYRLNGTTWQPAMTAKQGREYRVYSQKRAGGAVYYSLGGGLYAKQGDAIQYVPFTKDELLALVTRSLKGQYILQAGNESVLFVIERQKGSRLFGWYLYGKNMSLPIEGRISDSTVTLDIYFNDNVEAIADSISYLKAYNVPKDEIEKIAEQLANSRDYQMQLQFSITNSPEQFSGQFHFLDLYLDGRYDVVKMALGQPMNVTVKKND